MSANCNADYMHACDVNDGEPCADCAAWLADVAEQAASHWAGLSPEEQDPAKYEQDLRDSGRGHLLP